jgi:H+/Cl- antiporter ClcA
MVAASLSRQVSMMKKIVPFVFIVLGFLVMAGSCVQYAGNAIPYQDATAELLAHQATEAKKWTLLFALGLAVTATGSVWLWRRLRTNKRESH